jgi:ArsR family metal-binding transcriptional regulator
MEVPMLLEQIDHTEIFRPKCDPSKEVLHLIADFVADISPALPYLNAELGGWDYDGVNHALLLKMADGKWITFQAHQIAIRGCRDLEEAQALLAWAQGQINEVYGRRDAITPRFTGQAGLKIMEILKKLPRSNCRACGYATCMAYAAALREGEITPRDCPPLWEEAGSAQRESLLEYLQSYGWRALDEV